MILQSLVKLAERENLLSEPGYETRDVGWVIDVDESGRILAVIGPERDPDKPSRKLPRGLLVPRRRIRGGLKTLPDCLVDKAEYVFGIADRDDARQRASIRRDTMLTEVEDLAQKTKDAGLRAQAACMRAVREEPELLRKAFDAAFPGEEKESSPIGDACEISLPKSFFKNRSSLIAFRFNGTYTFRADAVMPAVRSLVDAGDGVVESGELCLVTGEWATPVPNHPTFALRGGTGQLPLVSFNQPAFEHYGRSGNANAPISDHATTAYVEALRRLADPKYRHPKDGASLAPRTVELDDKTSVLFWSDALNSAADPVDELLFGDCLAGASSDRIQEVERLYISPRSGGRPPLLEDPTPFHSLVLTRERSRVVLRSATTDTVGMVARNVQRWFQDLRLEPMPAREFRFLNPRQGLLRACVSSNSSRASKASKVTGPSIPPDLGARLYLCAISGIPFPRELLAMALRRIRAHDDAGESLAAARIALIRATINRSCRNEPGFIMEVPMGLVPDHPSAAYQLGRLFAVLESTQQKAIGGDGAGLAERYLGTACASPALVFPRILKLARHHLAKIGGGLQVVLDRQIDDILSRISPELQRTCSLVEQGSFLVGYHHQRANLFRKRDETDPASLPQSQEVES
jgi:CRISPR-associated protein Csd1